MEGTIEKVCDNKTPRTTDFINVDFPDAFGPVIKILFGFSSHPNLKSFLIALEVSRKGFQMLSQLIIGFCFCDGGRGGGGGGGSGRN